MYWHNNHAAKFNQKEVSISIAGCYFYTFFFFKAIMYFGLGRRQLDWSGGASGEYSVAAPTVDVPRGRQGISALQLPLNVFIALQASTFLVTARNIRATSWSVLLWHDQDGCFAVFVMRLGPVGTGCFLYKG